MIVRTLCVLLSFLCAGLPCLWADLTFEETSVFRKLSPSDETVAVSFAFKNTGDSAVVIKVRFRVQPPIQQWNVKREFLKRLKKAYDRHGIEIPFPHLTIYAGQAKDGGAPPFHLLTKAANSE